MSLARFQTEEPTAAVPYARCKRQPGDVYTAIYLGTQRAPQLVDEAGAIAVVECLFGGRVRLYAIASDSDHRRVEYDQEWRAP